MDKKYQIISRNLTKQDLDQVAKIHQQAFPDSLLTAFGFDAIKKYYHWQMTPPNNCYSVGVFQDNELLGFSFSGVLNNAELFFIKEYFPYFFRHVFKHPKLLFDKRIFNQLKKSMGYVKEYISKKQPLKADDERLKEKSFGILSTAVAPDHQGRGIGKLLTENIEIYARDNDYPSIKMSVHNDNEASIKLHEKLGYKKVASENGNWHGVMVKELKKK